MRSRIIIGVDVSKDWGLAKTNAVKALKLGNGIIANLPVNKTAAMTMTKFCRANGLRVYFREIRQRGHYVFGHQWGLKLKREQFFSKAELTDILKQAGPFYGGRCVNNESGSILYVLAGYTREFPDVQYANLPPARTVREAHDALLKYLKNFVEYERREFGNGPLMQIEGGLTFKYQAASGVDILCHEMMPGDPHLLQAGIRGAARAFQKQWGNHIAMDCYGGNHYDELWLKRFQTALYYAFLTGAQFIWPEGNAPFGYNQARGQFFGFESAPVRRERRIQRKLYQFSQVHLRPEKGPRVSLGVVHGNLDGFPGMWNKYVWGQQHDPKWLWAAPERGWDLVNKFHRKEEWNRETVRGEIDFSGNPPYGQYDVVPIEAPHAALKRYKCLLFLGWNTMTAEIYRKLKKYVWNGGHLIMYLAHLSTHVDRADDLRLYRQGDFSDLFGVKILGKGRKQVVGVKCIAESSLKSYGFPVWRLRTDPRFIGWMTPARVKVVGGRVISGFSGRYLVATPEEIKARPILVEKSYGKGKALLVTAWEYPGDEGLRPFTDDLVRTVLAGEQGEIRLLSSDRIRYAVYDGAINGRRYAVVYLLNTDPDCDYPARLWVRGRLTGQFVIPANELRLAYLSGGMALIPEDKRVDLRGWRVKGASHAIELYSCARQNIEIHNVHQTTLSVNLNGKRGRCRSGETMRISINKAADPARAEFFTDDFLAEPRLRGSERIPALGRQRKFP